MPPSAPLPDDGHAHGARRDQSGLRSPMEALSSYRGEDWTPQRLAFHQNLESFAERVGLIVALQSNGKLSQEQAYAEIRSIWNQLKDSKSTLLNHLAPPQH